MVSSEADTSERDKPLPSLNVSLCLSCWPRRRVWFRTDHKISGTLPVMFIAPKLHDTDLYWCRLRLEPSFLSQWCSLCCVALVWLTSHFLPCSEKKKSPVIVPWWGDGRRSDCVFPGFLFMTTFHFYSPHFYTTHCTSFLVRWRNI